MDKFKFNKKANSLLEAILSLKNIKEAEAFFRDLCTIEEINEMSERWEIVKMLNNKVSYREIAGKLKVSTTTVSRVANWFNYGEGGYKLILKRISHHHNKSFEKRL
jgi:TrpR-related protein YerC/YecD